MQMRPARRGQFRARLAPAAALAVIGAGLVGCVSQEEYDKLWETNRSLQNRNAELMNDLQVTRGQYDALSRSGTDAQQTIAALQGENGQLREQLGQANKAILGLEDRLASLEIGRLDPVTDLALSRLAARYPDLIVYDADRGMLRFASDLTFRSGSDEVQPQAAESLAALASVLKTPEAGEYDVKIVGHTDSQRISSGTAQRHPTNMHLSAHRAISVRRALSDSGVAADRMYAAGWGEFRPSVANSASGDTPTNRRVEIFLVPSTRDLYAASTAAPAPESRSVEVDTETPPTRAFEPTK